KYFSTVIIVDGILRPYGSALWPMFGLECCGIPTIYYPTPIWFSPLADAWIRMLWVNRYDSLRVLTFFLDMEFDYYTDTYVYDSNPKDLSVLNCLNYLKDKLVFTSDSKQDIQDALTRTVERIIDSSIVHAGVKKRLKKISDNFSATFQRKEIDEFFAELDKEFEARQNQRNLERSFDKNSFELLKKSGDLNTSRLSSYYIERSAEFHEKQLCFKKKTRCTIKKQYQVGDTMPPQLDKNEQDADFAVEQDTDNMYYQELSSVETSLNSAIERLVNSEDTIARYRILFLSEDNIHSPIKRLFTNEEWSIMESNWEKVEKRIADSLPQIDENVKLLLEKYSKCIKDATIKCYVDLNKVEGIICKSPFEDQHLYLFERDYHLRWVQLVYNAFILCLQTPFSPLCDPDASEYAYRSRIINYIWEELFFDVNVIAIMKTGEVENADRKKQLDLSRNLDQRKSTGTWHHDAVLVMKVGGKLVQVAFGEVTGNAFKRDDKKYNDDKEKILKAMQLALFNLRKSFPEKAPGLEDLETFGLLVNRKEFFMYSMHWVDGIYLVDQFDGFAIPDTSLDLKNLSEKQTRVITNEQEVSSTKDISPPIEGQSDEDKDITPDPLPEIEHSSTQEEINTPIL
ncbi:2841_t:CDS:10, partial [Ambispora gerdemannii]